jgi:hypothetical protein
VDIQLWEKTTYLSRKESGGVLLVHARISPLAPAAEFLACLSGLPILSRKIISDEQDLRYYYSTSVISWIQKQFLHFNMELQNLSSNWKKLQETLKKQSGPNSPSSSKRKISDHEPQNGVKRRKTEIVTAKKTEKRQKSFKARRMSQVVGPEGGHEGTKTATEGSSARDSTASIHEVESRNGQVNEGLSPTSVPK